MKVVILCGGKGTRLSEETNLIPKPMIKIGKKPILIHIMNIYQKYGFNEFVLAVGYKGFVIENYLKKNKFLKLICNEKGNIDKSNRARQRFPKTYSANGYVDIYKVKFILKNKMLCGKRSLFFETKYVTEVDDLENLKYLKYQLKNSKF